MQQNISVIIPSRNRSHLLQSCVLSIYKSQNSFPLLEIILVDNCTDTKESETYQQIAETYNLIYCREAQPGLSKARNAGIRTAKGDVIVFADDDFLVEPDWIKNLAIHFSESKVASCTGRMISHKKDEASQLYERSNSFDRGSTGYRVTAKDMNIKNLIKTIPLTGNKRLGRNTPAPYSVGYGFCSFRRNVFQKVGLFDEKLGRGTPAIGSEDVDIFYRILKAGYSIDYEPDAIVRHEHRATLDAVLYDAYSSGVSVRAFTRKYMARDPYIFCLFIGNFFLLSFSLTKNIFTRDHALRQMITQELKGFLVGKDKKH